LNSVHLWKAFPIWTHHHAQCLLGHLLVSWSSCEVNPVEWQSACWKCISEYCLWDLHSHKPHYSKGVWSRREEEGDKGIFLRNEITTQVPKEWGNSTCGQNINM
jgi:hypothetical protein